MSDVILRRQPGERAVVLRVDGNAVLRGRWGERVVIDLDHVMLAAAAFGKRLVDAGDLEAPAPLCSYCETVHSGPCASFGPAREGRHPRACEACLADMGVMSAQAFDAAGRLCDECGVRP